MNCKFQIICELILFLLSWILFSVSAQNIHFNRFTSEDGLSGSAVVDIIQDKSGYIWLATDDGLNRFDGYDFKVYRNIPGDSTSISGNSSCAIYEDRAGYIWIGTTSGELNRYDPLTDSFKSWDIKSDFVEENSILAIYEDRFGEFWIGTYKSGLYRFNPKTEKIEHWTAEPNNPSKVAHLYVMEFLEDNNGDLWIGTYFGLNKLVRTNGEIKFEHYFSDKNNPSTLSNNTIWGISQSNIDSNQIWIGTANGITSYRTDIRSFSQFYIPNPDNFQFGNSAGHIIDEKINEERFLWSESYAGLTKINIPNLETTRYRYDINNFYSLIDNRINKMFKDRSGVIWLGTENGICNFSAKNNKFNSVIGWQQNSFEFSRVTKKNITAVVQTSDSTIWFGADDGLYYTEKSGNSVSIKKHASLEGVHVYSMIAGGENELWIGTYGTGLKQLNYKTNQIRNWKFEHYKFKTYAIHFIKSLLKISETNILVGTWGTGLINLNSENGKFIFWLNENEKLAYTISHNNVWVLHKDKFGRIWVGTDGGGIDLFDESDGGKFYNILGTENVVGETDFRNINCITESKISQNPDDQSRTILWVGTSNGLFKLTIQNYQNKYVPSKEDIFVTYYSMTNGLPNNNIRAILEDGKGNLWISTSSGISEFDIEKNRFQNFTKDDGIIGDNFNLAAALKTDDGLFFFGSPNGLNYFMPDQIQISNFTAPVVLTDFQLFNQSVPVGENSILKTNIISAKEIELAYNEDVISFEFAALDYNSPKSIQYAYKMEGFDKDWVNSGLRRFVTYTNLRAGDYTFKVKATNSDGIWSANEANLKITIGNPWWATGWAYAFYLALFAAGLIALRRFELNRSRLKNIIKMREFESKKQREVDEMKTRFIANLSHEFRTPLLLIKGPLEQMINDNLDSKNLQRCSMVLRNTENLQSLINQLLELSQLESASIPVKAKKINLIILIKGLVSSFESLAKEKNINLSLSVFDENIPAWIDREKFEKIFNNLLSNAFKFTPEGGSIIVAIHSPTPKSPPEEGTFNRVSSTPLEGRGVGQIKSDELVSISVRDTGIGIPQAKLEKIFDRFYQVDDSSHRTHGGSGIGLALVKELVDLHRWNISVSSELNKGTEFIIKIPLLDNYLDESQKEFQEQSYDNGFEIQNGSTINSKFDEPGNYQISDRIDETEALDNKPSILIVEDSSDVQNYLDDLLSSGFSVSRAMNGVEGLKIAKEKIPDLIISDVMMPEMDGFEFCQLVKTDERTSHIPVILLTAKATSNDKIQGLETGADDYIMKPFQAAELKVRIKNLIDQRKKLQEYFKKYGSFDLADIKVTSTDKKFLDKTIGIVNNHLSDSGFGVDVLADEIGMSRSQLHRKLVNLIGESPGDLIRRIRLTKAAKLIEQNFGNVSEVALEVGYNNPANFAQSFKKQFGVSPTEYKK